MDMISVGHTNVLVKVDGIHVGSRFPGSFSKFS
jgi:hypothetical protein